MKWLRAVNRDGDEAMFRRTNASKLATAAGTISNVLTHLMTERGGGSKSSESITRPKRGGLDETLSPSWSKESKNRSWEDRQLGGFFMPFLVRLCCCFFFILFWNKALPFWYWLSSMGKPWNEIASASCVIVPVPERGCQGESRNILSTLSRDASRVRG